MTIIMLFIQLFPSNHANQITSTIFQQAKTKVRPLNTFDTDKALRQGQKILGSEGIALRCPRNDCNHQWVSHSESKHYTSCPYCRTSVHIIRDRVTTS